jgi:hypothetical protein
MPPDTDGAVRSPKEVDNRDSAPVGLGTQKEKLEATSARNTDCSPGRHSSIRRDFGPTHESVGPDLVRDLVTLIQQAEADEGVRALVFKSANPDYFISHVDVTKISEYRER